ncbi:MAG TPA: UDP-glucose 4-epimerase GalE [Acidimicrobiales bacterium]|nr:UDP-glucose 4-epimerase GalE [Acidimicrobiales bacterium]
MPDQGTVLVTGGAGYIGSHTCVALLQAGWAVVVLDNLSNSSPVAVERVRALAGGDLTFTEGDIRDRATLDRVFAERPIDAVVHFAGLKAVGESVEHPLRYFSHNVVGSVHLLEAMQSAGVRDLVFSSSCTVYGQPDTVPVTEDAPLSAASPYGRTKLFIEDMLRDIAASEPGWRVLLLRYFNPVGAHPSGTIGEDPADIPNNLMPFVMQVAVGRRDHLVVFGDDYPTPDGTCVRDYIHVEDLAAGHLAALEAVDRVEGCQAVNLGTGVGSSVLDVVRSASAAVGRDIPSVIGPRRAGDVAATWAEASLARSLLGWEATRTLADMCADHWRWQSQNPVGYERA